MGYTIIEISDGEVIEKSDKPADQPEVEDRSENNDNRGVQIVPVVPDGHLIEQERRRRDEIVRQIRKSQMN